MNDLEQAARAERLARSILDAYASEALMRYAHECRELAACSKPLCTGERQFESAVFERVNTAMSQPQKPS
jgi:hypothetical protein